MDGRDGETIPAEEDNGEEDFPEDRDDRREVGDGSTDKQLN